MSNNEELLPIFLLERLKNQYDGETIKKIINGYTENRFTTLRVNTLKSNMQNICAQLEEENIKYSKVKWSNDALIIENSSDTDDNLYIVNKIRNLKMYENGEIYLQSLSSMLPPIILNPIEKKDILDMAAAPGGKTTQIAALTRNESFITACEMNKLRAERLRFNIEKQGATSVSIMQTDARNLDDFFAFDQILLDAPCSGSGTINLNDAKKILFTESYSDKLEKTQLALLRKAIKLLKKGGEIVYSTCSVLYRENENIIEKVLKEEKNIEIEPIKLEGIEDIPKLPCNINGALLVAPNKAYEGFFVIKLRKI